MGDRLSAPAASWRWAEARAIGSSHVAAGQPCQDAVCVRSVDGPNGSVLLAAVSDGAGSARYGREGARAVVRGVLLEAERHFRLSGEPPEEAAVRGWLEVVRGELADLAERRAATPRDFAATLVAAFATSDATLFAHVGDGAAVIDAADGSWEVGSWPAGGEYAGTTYFVTDKAGPRLTVSRVARPVTALALFSDGIEHLILEARARRAYSPWFDRMFDVMRGGGEPGRDRALCRQLRTYLRSQAVDSRTHDDKSLILAVRA